MKNKISFKKVEIENIIKEEEATTLKRTKGVQKETGKFNDDYYKEVAKKFEDYNEPLKDTEKENSDTVVKYTNSEENQEYHDEYEILNGLEMTIYGNDPGEKFRDRAEKAIAGDSTMGNNPEWANVVTADQAGFTGPEFGKNLIARIKSRQKKSDAEAEKWNGMGDVPIPLGKPKKPNMAISENKKQVKMKRLRFKKPFTGVENALRLIPESYKVDNKTFQMTDGNEKYEIRWEGNITEGSAIILKASDKVLMNEDMQKMKHLMQYNSKDTLGNLRGKERINENKVFNDVWNKTKSIKESSAFGFGFTGEGNLEENEGSLDDNFPDDITTLKDLKTYAFSEKTRKLVKIKKGKWYSGEELESDLFILIDDKEMEYYFNSLGDGKIKYLGEEEIEDLDLDEGNLEENEPLTKKQQAAFGFGFSGEGNLKENEESIDEGLSKNFVSVIQKWIDEDGYHGAASRIIDSVLQHELGYDLRVELNGVKRHLPSTGLDINRYEYSHRGLRTVQDFLKTNEYEQAIESAQEIAREAIEITGAKPINNNLIRHLKQQNK